MTIEEVQARKRETENQIRNLLVEFIGATGLIIRGIELDAEQLRNVAINPKVAQLISNVRLDITIY